MFVSLFGFQLGLSLFLQPSSFFKGHLKCQGQGHPPQFIDTPVVVKVKRPLKVKVKEGKVMRLSIVDQMVKEMLPIKLGHDDKELVPMTRFHEISMIQLALAFESSNAS